LNEDGERRLELPEGLTREEERAIIAAIERHFIQESPKPNPWVLQGRIDAMGVGALQVRRLAREPWQGVRAPFARRGVPPATGRGDQG
jgi:hypothetical protein